jgi:hypothetical protein
MVLRATRCRGKRIVLCTRSGHEPAHQANTRETFKIMRPYKDPGFAERINRAAEAKQKALEKLRAKPPIDEAVIAERRAARLAKEARAAEAKAAKEAERAQRLIEKAAREAEAQQEAAAAAEKAVLSEAERKALRDARYAARKNRKK